MRITILQWNIWYKEDIRNIAAFLREHPADVICLQELTIRNIPEVGHTPDFIAKQLGYQCYYKEIEHPGAINIANGIFSKYPIVRTDWKWINETSGTGHYDDEHRAYVEATLDVNDTKVTVATAHMSYTNAFVSTPRKMQETQRLTDILTSKQGPFIFTGDLNAVPGSPTIQAIESVLCNAGPDYAQDTWTTKPFSYDGFEETELNWRLDYIFASPDVQTLNAKALTTDYSDHLPVWAEVEIRGTNDVQRSRR